MDRAERAPLRVMLLISNLEFGGAQRQVVELANALDPARVEVHVCTLSPYVPLAAELEGAGRRLHCVTKHAKFDVTVVPRLVWLLRRLRIDVVHSFLFDAEIAGRLAGRLARVPAVIGSERNADYLLKRRQLVAYRLTRRMVDLIIANSSAGAAFNAKRLGYPARMYRVVPNGVNTRRFDAADATPIRAELDLPPGALVVGMFGSFKRQKNHRLFLAAAQAVLRELPNARFLLVGDELAGGLHGSHDHKLEIERLIDDFGMRAACRVTGNRRDIHRLYSACDVTVLASLFEGTPNVALESMACGVPVIATDVSDNALVVPDGQAGYIVPRDDASAMADRICRILRSPDRGRQMGQQARVWVEREFSIRQLAERTLAVYREALAPDGGLHSRKG